METTTELDKKTMSFEEANSHLDKALRKIEANRMTPPQAGYRYLEENSKDEGLAMLGLFSFFPILLIGIFFDNPQLMFLITPTTILGICALPLMNWNGNPKNKIRSILAKYVITSKKKRMELKARQEEYKAYYEVYDVFRLYVSDIRKDLEDRGVIDTINQGYETNHLSINDNGESVYTKIPTDSKSINMSRAENMLKELSISPRIKDQLKLETQK